ncbi:MAG: Txe/YoeB family addiction module toxin [Coriobacteriaceae bacterium]|jgi:toxin YoeB|nr:Txe/YoeB family addiction module toxin [Coriobacteriaceae bacterium]
MRYELQFTTDAKSQIRKASKDKRFQAKLQSLLDAICADPYTGIGKPERLKYFDDNRWSRRIDQKNRLVYVVLDPDVVVISVIGHY